MTPQTLTIDRTFKGVGRIKKATGTTQPKVRRQLSNMLTTLYESGRLDVLRAIRDGEVTLLQAYDAYQRRAVESLPVGNAVKPLGEAMTKWIDSADVSDKHAYSLRQSLKYFLEVQADAKVSDLPAVLEQLRETVGVKYPRTFNLCRVAASRFIRATLKRSHPLYGAVRDVEARKVEPKRKRRPLSVVQMRNLFPYPPRDAVAAIAWGIVTTGMGAKEYWGRWFIRGDRIHIEGTKRKGRVRDVPYVLPPAVPQMHRRTWEDAIRERTSSLTPYDLRRTYANWLEAAGVPRTRRKLYLGHAAGDVTELYERHEVDGFLAKDARLLGEFINGHTKSHTMGRKKARSA